MNDSSGNLSRAATPHIDHRPSNVRGVRIRVSSAKMVFAAESRVQRDAGQAGQAMPLEAGRTVVCLPDASAWFMDGAMIRWQYHDSHIARIAEYSTLA